jgi:L-lactate dehydrogenase complex protein LldF
MRHYRAREWQRDLTPRGARTGLRIWAWFAKRAPLYHFMASTAMAALGWLGRKHGSFFNLPLAGGWTATREFPAPQGKTFQELWWAKQRAKGRS